MFGFLDLSPEVVRQLRGQYSSLVAHVLALTDSIRAIPHLHGRQFSHFHCWTERVKRGLCGTCNNQVSEGRGGSPGGITTYAQPVR